MKEYIFNEKKTIEAMIADGFVDEVNINRTIKKLARYNHYVRGLTTSESYASIVDYMTKNYAEFSEVGSYKDIHGCIKDAPKGMWKNIDKVVITKQELQRIQALDDIRKEKLAFVLLADAKYDNAYKNSHQDLSFISNSELYRLARVTMPTKERSMFLHFLYKDGLVEIDLNPQFTGKKLTYISSTDDEAALELTDSNYKELAFTYMNWKSGGYKECKSCGKLFKAKTNAQYCKKCSPKYQPKETKTIVCKDCGIEIIIDGRSCRKIRCDDCQHKKQLEYQRSSMKKRRDVK